MKLNPLEEKLLKDEHIDLAQGALIASGLQTEEIASYLVKLDSLYEQIEAEISVSENNIEKTKALFQWLWQTKPKRYKSKGNFRLTKVIDAQLNEKCQNVGNCLGLTLLYNILAQRLGLDVKAVHLEEAFGRAPHVFSTLHTRERSLDIENIFPYGFDYKGHLSVRQRKEWGNRELVADLYVSTGNSLSELDRWHKAVEAYDKAIKLNPEYTRAYLGKGIALCQLGRFDEASHYLGKEFKC